MNANGPSGLDKSAWRSFQSGGRFFREKAGFVRNALMVSALTIAVKVAGAMKVAISARVLGAGDELDAYLVAFLVPSILCDVLAGSLTPALIPALTKVSDPLAGRRGGLDRIFFLVCLGVFVTATLIGMGTSRWLLPLIAHGFSHSKLKLTRSLLLLMIPVAPFSGLSAMWRAVLNHRGRFVISAGSPLMTPLLASVFLLASNNRGIYSLALGTVLGCAAETSLLGAGLIFTGTSILPRMQRDFGIRRWLSIGYGPLLIASALSAGSNVVDQTIAASLQPGSVSVLNLGTRLAAVLLAIGPASVATVLMPRFSELIAEANWLKLRRLARGALMAGMLVMAALTAIGIWSAKPLAELAFARGGGAPEPITLIAEVQALAFLQLPFVMGTSILTCLLISLGLTRRLLLLTAFALVLKVVLGVLLSRLMGVAGLSLSMSCVQLAIFLMMSRIGVGSQRKRQAANISHSYFTQSLQDVSTARTAKN